MASEGSEGQQRGGRRRRLEAVRRRHPADQRHRRDAAARDPGGDARRGTSVASWPTPSMPACPNDPDFGELARHPLAIWVETAPRSDPGRGTSGAAPARSPWKPQRPSWPRTRGCPKACRKALADFLLLSLPDDATSRPRMADAASSPSSSTSSSPAAARPTRRSSAPGRRYLSLDGQQFVAGDREKQALPGPLLPRLRPGVPPGLGRRLGGRLARTSTPRNIEDREHTRDEESPQRRSSCRDTTRRSEYDTTRPTTRRPGSSTTPAATPPQVDLPQAPAAST